MTSEYILRIPAALLGSESGGVHPSNYSIKAM